MIETANEVRLLLSDNADLNAAACAVTCWAGPENGSDIGLETGGPAAALIVDKTWCDTRGPLIFTTTDGQATTLCPLPPVASVPTPLLPCRAADCELAPVVTITGDNPVTVTIAGHDGSTYRIEWGTDQAADRAVAADATVSHTYRAAGAYTVRVYDEQTGVVAGPFPVTILAGPHNVLRLECPGDQTGTAGEAVSLPLTVADSDQSVTAFTWTATGLPAGLALNNLGDGQASITGTLTTAQPAARVSVTVADDSGGSYECWFTWAVDAGTTVTLAPVTTQTSPAGEPVSLQIEATDSDPDVTSFTWDAAGLPDGLTIDDTGLITGAPGGRRPTTVTVTATDPNGATDSTSFLWGVTTEVTVTRVTAQTWTQGEPITDVVPEATDSDAALTTFTWSITPTLPAGVAIDEATGTISGTPASLFIATDFTLTATDELGAAGSTSFSIAVNGGGA